ncbi:unnamed protein product [Brassica oleracea var. botrytis]
MRWGIMETTTMAAWRRSKLRCAGALVMYSRWREAAAVTLVRFRVRLYFLVKFYC